MSGFMGPLMAHFVQRLTADGVPYFMEFHHHSSADHELPRSVASGMVDGVLLLGDVGAELTDALKARRDFPWVSIGEFSDYCVLNDADRAIASAASRLVALGHRRLAYAGGPECYQEHLESRHAFERSVAGLGLDPMPEQWSQTFPSARRQGAAEQVFAWAEALLARGDRPTAVICRSEPIARTVLYAAARRGLSVPDELSVISWGWDSEAQSRYPSLATLAYGFTRIVDEAMELLKHRLAHDGLPPQTRRVPMQLVEGQTLGPTA